MNFQLSVSHEIIDGVTGMALRSKSIAFGPTEAEAKARWLRRHPAAAKVEFIVSSGHQVVHQPRAFGLGHRGWGLPRGVYERKAVPRVQSRPLTKAA